MTSTVAVVGGGARAGEWATRFLAASLDVVVDDPTVRALVEQCWPAAERLGLVPGASIDRLTVTTDPRVIAEADLVQLIGDAAAPDGARLVANEASAAGHHPIHLLPLVELAATPESAQLARFYRSVGMVPCLPDVPETERRRLGPAITDLTGDDPDAIIAVMRSLRPSGTGAGVVVAELEARRFAASAPRRWRPADAVAAPLAIYDTRVEPDWVDYNGHMTEAAYLTAAGWASDALFRYIGDDEAYRSAGHSFYTVETHINYLLEVDLHEPLHFTTQILGVDAKRVHLFHSMYHGDSGALLCTAEQMLVHVDTQAHRSSPILAEVAAALEAIGSAHATLDVPKQVGRVMRLHAARSVKPTVGEDEK